MVTWVTTISSIGSRPGWATTSWATCTSSPAYTGWKDFGGAMAPAKIVQTRGGLPFFQVDVTAATANPPDVAALVPAARAGCRSWWTRRRRGRGPRRPGACAHRDRRKARRRPLPADHWNRQLRLAARGVQGLPDDPRSGTERSAVDRLHRRSEEARPQQADPLCDEHARSLRSHGRTAGDGRRRRDDHHAEEQPGVFREGPEHTTHAARPTTWRRIRRKPRSSPLRRRRSTRTARAPSRCTISIRPRIRTAC